MRAMKIVLLLMIVASLGSEYHLAFGQSLRGKTADWKKIVTAATKEGKVVVSVPTSAELRTQFENVFQSEFPGIALELNVGRGSTNIAKIVEEQSAGVHGIDVHVGGSTSIIRALLPPNFVEPLMPMMVLPEVKDSGNWWGGHMWADHAKTYVYDFTAFMTETVWYNANLVKPEEIATYDDLLAPKWKGKIAILDPRTPGSGESTWSFLWRIKGKPFLKKLVAQDMLVGRNLRQLAEAVARGKAALSIGLSYYSYRPFVEAGLPVKPIRAIKEGFYGSTGSGNVVVIKNTAHPNAAKVFLNWLLSKQGQAVFTKALGQPTRRLDVDTSWTRQFGHVAAKDTLTPEKYEQVENSSEDVVKKFRKPAMRLAKQLLK